MASVWAELKRRNVVKVAAAYAIVGWLVVQIADVFFPALQLPEWTVTFVAALLILGFPVALLLSWAYELTPDGIERTKSVSLSESITKVTGRKLDHIFDANLDWLVCDNLALLHLMSTSENSTIRIQLRNALSKKRKRISLVGLRPTLNILYSCVRSA